MCVRCDGKGDNDTAVMNAVEKMKINEPHGLAMCSRIYARDETANEDQTVDFHGDGVEWRGIFEKIKERWYRGKDEKKIRTVRIRCFPKELEVGAYKILDELIEEAQGKDKDYGLTGPGKGVSARECDVALDAVLIRG